jgi:hypothetical protein
MTRAAAPPDILVGPDNGKAKKKKAVKSRKGPTKWYKEWSWPNDVREAFLTLRKKFTEAPVLQHFDLTKPVIVITNASEYAMAAILLQPTTSDVLSERYWKLVAFWSKKFSSAPLR